MGYTADSTSHWVEALSEVFGRRTEEVSMTTKRLKELLESRKASSQYTFGNSNGSRSMSTLKSCIFCKQAHNNYYHNPPSSYYAWFVLDSCLSLKDVLIQSLIIIELAYKVPIHCS
ncbi:hypothetical protein Hanom_Chr06g00501431 [Helianthus anomalus]